MRVCVFCGSRAGARPDYVEAARAVGLALGRAGHSLVYGGSGAGLMGAVADGALEAGAHVTGIFPREFGTSSEFAHPRLSERHEVGSMHDRKALMHELSDAFLALPGGFGTLDELFETLTWAQLGFHRKPVGVLDLNGFFTPMLQFVRHALAEGFIPPALADVLLVKTEPEALVSGLSSFTPPLVQRRR